MAVHGGCETACRAQHGKHMPCQSTAWRPAALLRFQPAILSVLSKN